MKEKTFQLRTMTMTAMLAAVSIVLMYLEFSVPFVPSFLKFDFSDLPALIGSFAFGPICGVLICLVKNVVHLFATMTGGIGELSNFLLSMIFVLPAGIIYKKKKTRRRAFFGALIGTFSMAAVSVFTNYFVVYPIYYNFMPKETVLGLYQAIFPFVKNMWQALIVCNVPFTIVKGLCNTLICFLIYHKISPLLKGKRS